MRTEHHTYFSAGGRPPRREMPSPEDYFWVTPSSHCIPWAVADEEIQQQNPPTSKPAHIRKKTQCSSAVAGCPFWVDSVVLVGASPVHLKPRRRRQIPHDHEFIKSFCSLPVYLRGTTVCRCICVL